MRLAAIARSRKLSRDNSSSFSEQLKLTRLTPWDFLPAFRIMSLGTRPAVNVENGRLADDVGCHEIGTKIIMPQYTDGAFL